ncbi:MAG: hypothetical protein FJ191_13685 [Gammaproteobacteria bacterium]|nr:hypothetical protein [Gammaproteobacteria bacterium]
MRFAVLDCETTGFRKGDRIVELAAGVVENGAYLQTLHFRLHPGIPIPAEATAVHGYGDASVAGLEAFDAGKARELLDLLTGAEGPVYAHNVPFDLETILLPEFARVGADAAALAALPWSCTLKMARELWPGEPNDLGAVAERLGVEFHGAAHSATVDVDVLRRCVEQVIHRYAYRSHRGALTKPAPAQVAAPSSTVELVELAGAKAAPFLPRVKAAQEWAAGFVCADDADEANGHAALASIKRVQAEAEAERKACVEPVKAISSRIDTLYREAIARPCDVVRGEIEAKLQNYAAARLAAQRAAELEARHKLAAERAEAQRLAQLAALEKARIEAEAERARAAAQAAELEARRKGDAEAAAAAALAAAAAEAQVEAAKKAAEANSAEQAARVQDALAEVVSASSPVGPVKAQGATGGYAVKLVVRIVDPAKVPDVYWRPDLELVQRAVDQGARDIPGVVIDEQVQVSNRRRG